MLACSDEPNLPSARTVSMSLLTALRISPMRAHLVSKAASAWPKSTKVSKKMDSEWPNKPQASSAVKLRNGAIQRSMACVIWCKAVCALRRASDLGAEV